MLKENKIKIVISSIIILLPMLFGVIMWNDLPDSMLVHWGADGNADGLQGKAFAVFGLPAIILILHIGCLLYTLHDNKTNNQNTKALGIIFWIIPGISLFANGMIYRTALGGEFNSISFLPAILGLMFIFIGNYLPKVKQNRTLGIKVAWALNNEENWNKTHRLGGKVWVAGGLIMLFSLFLPATLMMFVMMLTTIIIILIPVLYSYSIYKKHQKEGIAYHSKPTSKAEKITYRTSSVIGIVILIGVVILMFTGNIKVKCEDTFIEINATYWADKKVNYSEIDTIEYRNNLNVGSRANGFGSPRLSIGIFENTEFGRYTLYAYTGAAEYIVITSDENILVIGMSDVKDTKAIYDTILEKISE